MKKINILALVFVLSVVYLCTSCNSKKNNVLQILPNADFDSWYVKSKFENPVGWSTSNRIFPIGRFTTVTKDTINPYSGNTCVRMETVHLMGSNTLPGLITTGDFKVNIVTQTGKTVGGIQLIARPSKLKGYYRYHPKGNDRCVMNIEIREKSNEKNTKPPLGSGQFTSAKEVSEWTYFEVPVEYTSDESRGFMNISILSSDTASMTQGSVLWVDQLALEYSPAEQKKLDALNPQDYSKEQGNDKMETSEAKFSLPKIRVITDNNPDDGYLFINGYMSGVLGEIKAPMFVAIVDNTGKSFFVKEGAGFNFNIQENGSLTYFDPETEGFIVLNSAFEAVDTLLCKNGYEIDSHGFKILENGNALLLCTSSRYKEDELKNLTKGILPIGTVIQEIDKNKKLIFEWKSWEHYRPNEVEIQKRNIAYNNAEYRHPNAIEIDVDGNILLSSRDMCDITKINKSSGEVMWRLGGRYNDFRFLNDLNGFRSQHDIRLLANGNLLLFDNGDGNPNSTPFSSAKEYQLNRTKKTVKLVWQYKHPANIFALAMGSVQRLPNGNTIMNWGGRKPVGNTVLPSIVTEVTPNGNVAFEFEMDSTQLYSCYRLPWKIQKAIK